MTVSTQTELSNTNFNGRFRMNKKLTTNTEEVLRIQRVPWVFRKLIVSAPASASSLTYAHYWSDDGVEHIDSLREMVGVASLSHRIARVPDNKVTEKMDEWAGAVKLTCWWGSLEDLPKEQAYLKGSWDSVDEGEKLLFSLYESLEHRWSVLEVTTVQDLNGQKHLATYSIVTGTVPKHEVVNSQIVYDLVQSKHTHVQKQPYE